jgi:hypothetical protein
VLCPFIVEKIIVTYPSFSSSHTAVHKVLVTSALLLIVFMAGMAEAVSLEESKRAGEYHVGIRMDRNPPILGVNNLEVEIRGEDGATVTDAKVLVNYYMPPMPRMAPMNYKIDAPFKGDRYRAKMHFIMEGPWYIAVKINHQGKTTTAKFNVNVP